MQAGVRRLAFLSLCLFFQLPAVSQAEQAKIQLSSSLGPAWEASVPPAYPAQQRDWLVEAYPLFVAPGMNTTTVITVDPAGSDPAYNGSITLRAICCGIPGGPGLAFPGIDAQFERAEMLPVAEPAVNIPPSWIRSNATRLLMTEKSVLLSGQPRQIGLRLTIAPGTVPVPGNWKLAIRARDEARNVDKTMEIGVSVLGRWPQDGPAPACAPKKEVLPLSRLNLYEWKARNLSKTSIEVGTVFNGSRKGLKFTIRKPDQPLRADEAIVSFYNSSGRDTKLIRNSNSANCAPPSPTRVVNEGESVRFTISSMDTSTLVFGGMSCRFYVPLFGCLSWGQDDFVQFSEGPFWAAFGGHEVEFRSVGSWAEDGAIGEISTP